MHWLSPPPTSDKIYYMALQGGAYDLGNFTQPTSTVPVKQTIKETIQPNALMLSSFNGIASTILKSNNRISFGTSDNTTSIGVWTGDRSLASNSITARSENTTRVITLATEQATGANSITNATASVVTMNATGFTLNWTKDDSVARQILYTTFGRNPIDNDIIITEKTIPTSMTNFTFTSTTLTPSSFNLANYANSNDTKIFANLLPGTYNMTQNANKNYTTTYSCNDGSPTKAIKLKSGQTITCTFVNTLTKKDIVVTNGRYQNVTVLSGNGTGRFGAITEFNASNNFPASLAVADFNGDGNLDIVAPSSAFSDNISILLNNGTGGFGSPQVFSAGGITATSVATADFNNDGKQDVVVSEGGSNNIEILLGNGTGGLGNPASFSVGSGSVDPVGVATADFNNDGKQDVVTADLVPNKISVLLGNGTGGFGTAKLFGTGGTSPYGIATADFNNDGKQDVVTTNSQSNNVSIFIGNGTGGFSSITTYGIGGTAPYGVAVGDVNGDGKLDIVTANQISNNTSVLLGDGSGGFGSPTMFNVGANAPSSVGLGDFNNDGKLDIVTVNTDLYNTSISVLLGNGTGGFGTPKVTTLSGLHSFCCTSVAVADFNPGH